MCVQLFVASFVFWCFVQPVRAKCGKDQKSVASALGKSVYITSSLCGLEAVNTLQNFKPSISVSEEAFTVA